MSLITRERVIIGLDRLKYMGGIIWETLFCQLTAIETVHKQLDGGFQGISTAGETPRFASRISPSETRK
jgi:hypothetical protein